MAHPVDLLVDGRFLLDEGIGARHIGFGLVVIVIADEIFHRIVGEKAFELAVKLRRQRLVGRENEGGALGAGNHLRHGEGFARTGDAEQHLIAVLRLNTRHEFFDGSRLVASGFVIGHEGEGFAAFGFIGADGTVRGPFFLVAELRITQFQQFFQRIQRGGRTRPAFFETGIGLLLVAVAFDIALTHLARLFGQHRLARQVLVAATADIEGGDRFARVELRLRNFRKPPHGGIAALVVLLLPVQGGIEQGRQMRSQFFQFRLGGLRAFALGSRFRGFDHEQ